MCCCLLRAPTPLYSILWPIIDTIFVTFRQICNFRDPNLFTFCFYKLTHFLDWMKNTLLFICSTNILVRLLTVNMKNCLTPKNPKMCDPILVTLSKMRPHYSQSGREKATPFSGTCPLASYKEVPPPPLPFCKHLYSNNSYFSCLYVQRLNKTLSLVYICSQVNDHANIALAKKEKPIKTLFLRLTDRGVLGGTAWLWYIFKFVVIPFH